MAARRPHRPQVGPVKRAATLVVCVALAALLAACGPVYTPGPDGTVTDRWPNYVKNVGWRYWLTVTPTAGGPQTFRVAKADFDHCFHGSHYPACTHRSTP